MKTKSRNTKVDTSSFWTWKDGRFIRKQNNEKRFPITEIITHNKPIPEEMVLGPGGGAGIGCGAGVGFGLVGGLGYGGWPWNQLKLVFGAGLGCGVGLGFGFGQGIGYGFSLESFRSYFSKPSLNSNKRPLIEI